jgi:hypothetical protein
MLLGLDAPAILETLQGLPRLVPYQQPAWKVITNSAGFGAGRTPSGDLCAWMISLLTFTSFLTDTAITASLLAKDK